MLADNRLRNTTPFSADENRRLLAVMPALTLGTDGCRRQKRQAERDQARHSPTQGAMHGNPSNVASPVPFRSDRQTAFVACPKQRDVDLLPLAASPQIWLAPPRSANEASAGGSDASNRPVPGRPGSERSRAAGRRPGLRSSGNEPDLAGPPVRFQRYSKRSISLGRHVLSNQGCSGPYSRSSVFQPFPGMVCIQLSSLPAGASGPK